ncbi:hypothetical protein BWR22_02685 [Lacinutrix venerupis]|uniref:DUF4296 domain-containing protein n=1 Tax=Lacinutrix venerupis TaxID=1486034 RepID=A0AAC9PW99_9FLAO|nr:hypothetical protein BWR22_02685 [Lacinutrix venerupis]
MSSCFNVEKPEKPKNLITEDNMVNILVDMAIMSSAKGVNKSKIEKNGIVPDQYIYDKNNTDSLTFAESNAYYAYDIKKYDIIYNRVKDSLTAIREGYKEILEKEKAEKKIKDSIKNAKAKIEKGKNLNNKQLKSLNATKLIPKKITD